MMLPIFERRMGDPEAPRSAPAQASAQWPPSQRPFVVENGLEPSTQGQVPTARLLVETEALRSSGLLSLLTDEAAKTLLAVLCHLSRNGCIRPTAAGVAETLGVGEPQARERLGRLAAVSWRGEPLLWLSRAASGLETASPSWKLLSERAAVSSTAASSGSSDRNGAATPSRRAAIYENTRRHYSVPRQEVERQVLEQLGHAPEEADDTPEGDVLRRISALGLPRDAAQELLSRFGVARVRRQLEWLPQRQARNPLRFLLSAVEGDYGPPLSSRFPPHRIETAQVPQPEAAGAPDETTSPELPAESSLPTQLLHEAAEVFGVSDEPANAPEQIEQAELIEYDGSTTNETAPDEN